MNPKVTIKNGVSLELIKENFTAQVIYSPRTRSNVFIPNSITYQSQDYTITTIKSGSFKNNHIIKKLEFSADSSIHIIEKNAFKKSTIQTLFIPSKLEELQKGWCNQTSDLMTVIISPNNPNFKYSDESHQIILGKSDKSTTNFDVVVFGSRDIQTAAIPDNITQIQSYSFQNCENLKTINISENSELRTIGKKILSLSMIRHFFIPSKVEKIQEGFLYLVPYLRQITISPHNRFYKFLNDDQNIIVNEQSGIIMYADWEIRKVQIPWNIKRLAKYAFNRCNQLEAIEISENSELRSIGKKCFFETFIKEIFFPKNLSQIQEGWCDSTPILNEVKISPKNEFFKYADENCHLIVGKSENGNFDVLKFGCRFIEKVEIPDYIRHIDSNAFEYCSKLKEVKIPPNSELRSIGKEAFSSSKIESFVILKNIEKIDNAAFYDCDELESISIEKGSKLQKISKNLFYSCDSLQSFEIPEESEIKIIESGSFNFCSIDSFYIPSSVEEIEEKWLYCSQIDEIIISPNNRNFKYDEDQILLGKSDKNKDEFDVVLYGSDLIENVTIPDSIKYINHCAFRNCEVLNTIEISENSELRYIGKFAFSHCPIKHLFIPPKLEVLQDDWCDSLLYLNSIQISPKNNNFKYSDNSHQIILGKSDIDKDVFDVVVFGTRDIITANIPNSIKHIQSNSFSECTSLNTINICENSNLQTIGNKAFSKTNIIEFLIPKNVKIVDECAFYACSNLEKIEIEKGSKLNSLKDGLFNSCTNLKTVKIDDFESNISILDEEIFSNSSIEIFHIPSSVQILNDEWCQDAALLKTVTVSPYNQNIKFLDKENQFLVCKSKVNSDCFDILSFADRSIEKVIIPSFIKCIQSYVFANCKKLKKVEFENNSELRIIGSNSFSSTAIKSIIIPKSVRNIGLSAFDECDYLIAVEVLSDVSINLFDFLGDLNDETIISFPNLHILYLQELDFDEDKMITLFVCTNTQIIITD